MIKNIFAIYKRDLKSIFSNYAALIVVAALCLLPSLYAWFNIKASWDPYSESATSQILIGVVNKDEGATLQGKDINIGQDVVDELKENHALGWQFVDELTAHDALIEGEYFATITIPSDFSDDITSLITDDVKKAEIIYAVNEKINAIAPKLTDKGATSVQENVNKTVVETVSHILLSKGKDVGFELEEDILPKLSTSEIELQDLQSKFSDIEELISLAEDGTIEARDFIDKVNEDLPLVHNTIENAQQLIGSVESFMISTEDQFQMLFPTIKEDLRLVSTIASQIQTDANTIKDAIASGVEIAPELVSNLIKKVETGQNVMNSVEQILSAFNQFAPNQPLTPIIEKLQDMNTSLANVKQLLVEIKTDLDNGVTPDTSRLDHVLALASSVADVTSNLYEQFDSEIKAPLNDILSQALKTADGVSDTLNSAADKLPQVNDLLQIGDSSAKKGQEAIAYVKEKLPEAESLVAEVVTKLDEINTSKDLKEAVRLLQDSVQQRTDFLKTPVNLVENKVFTIPNYGSAMTPFYSVLAIWVGVTFLISMLNVHAHGEYKSVEVYFGKLLLFITIGLIQSFSIAMGDLYLLNVYCLNPLYFTLALMFSSVVFVFIGYTLLSVFGNVGKVCFIILLVLQVAGSGGTFPVQLTPPFFQAINPFLPFTYSISLVRETMGGIVPSVFYNDVFVLSLYVAVAIVVAVVLKTPLNKLMAGFTKKYAESGIGE